MYICLYICVYIYIFYIIFIFVPKISKIHPEKKGHLFLKAWNLSEIPDFGPQPLHFHRILQAQHPPSGLSMLREKLGQKPRSSLVDQLSLCYTLLFLLKLIFCTSCFFSILEPSKIKNIMFQNFVLLFVGHFQEMWFHVTSFLSVSMYLPVLISWKFNAPEGLPLGVSPLRHPIADEVEECRAGRAEGPLRSGFLGQWWWFQGIYPNHYQDQKRG